MAADAPLCAQLAALPADAEPNERLYAAGECALERHDYRKAIRVLEELVGRDTNPIYRAELGRAYLGAQEFERARAQFQQVLESNPPVEARKLLTVFIQMADQQQTQAKEWFASVSIGQLYDSNINSGPISADVMLFGLPFTMGESGMPRSDRALRAVFSAVHVKPLDGAISWQSNASAELIRYQTYAQYDTSQVTVDTGPHLSLADGQVDLYLPVGLGRTSLNGASYTASRSVSPEIRYTHGQSDQAILSLPLARIIYVETPAMTTISRSMALTWRHSLAGFSTLEPSLRYGIEDAVDKAFSNIQRSADLALRRSLPARLRLNAEATYTRSGYRETEIWADTTRADTRLNYSLSLSRDLEDGYYATLSWLSMRTHSNLALYSSKRTQIQFQISKSL